MIHAITVASKETEGLGFLRESAARQGWGLKILWTDRWRDNLEKLRTVWRFMEDGKVQMAGAKIFMVDGFDCYAQRPLIDLPECGEDFLISGHKRCFPEYGLTLTGRDGAQLFPHVSGGYRYLCGGAWMAKAEVAKPVIDWMLHYCLNEKWEQGALMMAKAEGLPMRIDHRGEMAFTVFKEDLCLSAENGRFYNRATGMEPVVVHGNNGTWHDLKRRLVFAGRWPKNEGSKMENGKVTRKQMCSAEFQRAFQRLMGTGLGFKTNIALAKAWRRIQEEVEVFQKATLAQLERFEAVQEESGWRFPSIEKKTAFEREQAAAGLEEIDLGLERVRLPEKCEMPAEVLAPLLELLEV